MKPLTPSEALFFWMTDLQSPIQSELQNREICEKCYADAEQRFTEHSLTTHQAHDFFQRTASLLKKSSLHDLSSQAEQYQKATLEFKALPDFEKKIRLYENFPIRLYKSLFYMNVLNQKSADLIDTAHDIGIALANTLDTVPPEKNADVFPLLKKRLNSSYIFEDSAEIPNTIKNLTNHERSDPNIIKKDFDAFLRSEMQDIYSLAILPSFMTVAVQDSISDCLGEEFLPFRKDVDAFYPTIQHIRSRKLKASGKSSPSQPCGILTATQQSFLSEQDKKRLAPQGMKTTQAILDMDIGDNPIQSELTALEFGHTFVAGFSGNTYKYLSFVASHNARKENKRIDPRYAMLLCCIGLVTSGSHNDQEGFLPAHHFDQLYQLGLGTAGTNELKQEQSIFSEAYKRSQSKESMGHPLQDAANLISKSTFISGFSTLNAPFLNDPSLGKIDLPDAKKKSLSEAIRIYKSIEPEEATLIAAPTRTQNDQQSDPPPLSQGSLNNEPNQDVLETTNARDTIRKVTSTLKRSFCCGR